MCCCHLNLPLWRGSRGHLPDKSLDRHPQAWAGHLSHAAIRRQTRGRGLALSRAVRHSGALYVWMLTSPAPMKPARLKRILFLALPVMAGMLSQNIMSLVDMLMVGRLGNAALAAVGFGGFVVFACTAITLGIATGVQAMCARRKGAGRTAELAVPLNAGLLVMAVAGPIWSALLFMMTPSVFPMLVDDPAVAVLATPYVQWRMLAITFVGANFAFRGYWTAIDLTRIYLGTLLLMNGLNIVLNYGLIFGAFGLPEMGVTGAGVGTLIATAFGCAVYTLFALRLGRSHGFMAGLPGPGEWRSLARLSIPYGLQQLLFAVGFTVLYWIIAQVGTRELAAASVLVNVTLVAILPGIGLGIASATLVGQALGRGDPQDAARWAWEVVAVGVVGLSLLGVPMWLAPEAILGVFIEDTATVAAARIPMQIVGATMAVEAVGLVLMHSLHGAGDSKRAMTVGVGLQWLAFLPIAYLLGPVWGGGLLAIWLAQLGYRCAQALIFASLWKRGDWQRLRV